ncbi:MAG: polyhydroxyalkanoate synthesis repressor PhaR [Alphaproteobacteria bacterium]|nr:polyhydroxyalkanoate synthesis repressor PhaR [Alphaproteobacteria bacterium]MCW5741543.1 polyhydroxyalkanoate synthesis repressor PhaR [Alphaproteobacteria bacterium]
MATQPESGPGAKPAPVVIKKYANRRLYNTSTSMYVTLDHLSQMVKEKTEFVVYDAKTGEDITRSVLTQIIFEEESKSGQNLLPISFLRQLIAFYGDNLQGLVPQYLDMSMQAFARNQEQMRQAMQNAFGFKPFSGLEDAARQNMAMFQQAMKLMNPFMAGMTGAGVTPPDSAPAAAPDDSAPPVAPVAPPPPPSDPAASGQGLEELRRKLEELQAQLSALSTKREG